MAVSTTNAISGPYTTNGSTTVFPFTFTTPSTREVAVVLVDGDGVETVVSSGSYTVTLGTDGGGSVEFDTAPASGYDLYVQLDPEFTQDIEFEDGSGWLAAPVNLGNDRAAARDQYLKARVDKLVPDGLLTGAGAGQFLAYDASGNPIFSTGTGADAGLRTDLAAPTGAALVGFKQAGTGAVARTMQDKARDTVSVKDFGAVGDGTTDDTAALQAALDFIGDTLTGGVLNLGVGTFKTTSTLRLPPYVSIVGQGRGRSAIVPTMSSGPAISAALANGDEAFYHQSLRDFRIDGVNATGSAYALYIEGQQNSRVVGLGIWRFATTSYALQLTGNTYGLLFDDLHMLQNDLYVSIQYGATSFPTNILFRRSMFEDGTLATPNTAPAILIKDANSVMFDQRCIFQALPNLETIRMESTANKMTSAEHTIAGCYFETNGGGQATANTLNLVGASGYTVDRVRFNDNRFHGTGGGGGHIKLAYSDRFTALFNSCDPAQKWLTDGGNNTVWDIDARYMGTCDLQSGKYIETALIFSDAESITYTDGPLAAAITKQSTGHYDVDFTRAFTSTAAVFHTVQAFDAGGDPLDAFGYMASTTQLKVVVKNLDGTAAANVSHCFVSIRGDVAAYS